ncbi:MAG: outer membrane beta-barrel protein, partial [Bacteroidales bacterium]|nr:outer membrane beta-barrel protein [Bacteroidales bacterium]
MKTFIKLFLVAALLLSQGICAAQPLPAADTLTTLTDSLAATKVTARKNKVIYRIDKTVISGAANATAEGRTAADIISTLPSVRTDAQGDITFRGSSGFLVYVNGKPSMLEGTAALRQIQASNVEDIEIITTPSANFQSDGEAGIINIITKKGEGEGLTGSINLAGSTLGSYNADILIGYRRGHNHFYGGVESSSDKRKSEFYQEKNTDVLGVETTSVSDGFRFGNNRVNIGRLGWEFEKGRHRLTLELQGGQTENRRGGDMTYDETRDFAGNPQMSATFNSADRYILRKNMVQLSPTYRFEINDKGDYLSFIGRFRYDIYSLEYTESNLHYQNGSRYEGTRGFEEEHHDDYDFTISYCKNLPVGKFETGYQMTYYTEIGGYRIRYWEPEAQDFEWQEDLAAPFYYRRQVHSLYAMCSGNEGSLSWDAGLRGDCVIDDVDVEVPDGELHQKIPNLFPSGHLRWAINSKSTITAGYSYRVNRPGIWQTEPYITYEDYYTKKKGNMHIRPNYIQSAEASFRRTFGKGSHILANLFLRSSKDKLEWI